MVENNFQNPDEQQIAATSSTPPPNMAEDQLVTCPACNTQNRVNSADIASAICGACDAPLTSNPQSPTSTVPPPPSVVHQPLYGNPDSMTYSMLAHFGILHL